MKKPILFIVSTLLFFVSCSKSDDANPEEQQQDPPPKEDVISVTSSLTVNNVPVSYTLDSKLSISSQWLSAGDGSNSGPATETTISISSLGLSGEDFFEGKVIDAQKLINEHWNVRLFTVNPQALFSSRSYTGSSQGKITVVEYDEYENDNGTTRTGKVSLQFDNVKVQDIPGVKTINGSIMIEQYVY